MENQKQIKELRYVVLMALVERGVFSMDNNPKVTKFQGGVFHLKSDNDSGKAALKGKLIQFDTVVFGIGTTELIENRHSEKPEVKELITKFGIEDKKMETTVFVYDRKSGEIKKFEMHKTFNEMNNGIKAMQVQRVQLQINKNDLILNTNLDRYIK